MTISESTFTSLCFRRGLKKHRIGIAKLTLTTLGDAGLDTRSSLIYPVTWAPDLSIVKRW